MAQPRQSVAPVSHRRAHPPLCREAEVKSVPWIAVIVLILAVIIILSLWGKLPHPPRFPREAPPASKSPATSLFVPSSAVRC